MDRRKLEREFDEEKSLCVLSLLPLISFSVSAIKDSFAKKRIFSCIFGHVNWFSVAVTFSERYAAQRRDDDDRL